VTFVNDAWGGTASTDRNMYIDWIEVNGKRFEGENAAYNGASLKKSPTEAIMETNGTVSFDITGAAPDAKPAPVPVIVAPDAKPTPAGASGYYAPNGSGTATGTSGADNLYATGAGQTLNGNGGNDVFHIGSFADTKIVAAADAITTVSTWAGKYTLADGVDNLVAQGNYRHELTGNSGHNWIKASEGNDVIHGGAGNDVLEAGTGASRFTGGTGSDLFVFSSKAAHDNVITDFTLGTDMIDVRGALSSAGYNGTDPVADGYLGLVQTGTGTTILFDADGTGGAAAHNLVTIENILPSALKLGVDIAWH